MNDAGLNKLMLIGRVGRKPEMRYTAHGVPVTTFSIATARNWVDSDGATQVATDWFNVVSWRHLAEQCYECLHKGSRVYLEGRVQTRSWEDEDGERHYQVEVVASEVMPLDPPAEVGYEYDWPADERPSAEQDDETAAERVEGGAIEASDTVEQDTDRDDSGPSADEGEQSDDVSEA